jgi:tight adherence protein B
MDPLALLASATVAAAVTLIAIGIAGATNRRAVDRLAAYPTAGSQPVVAEDAAKAKGSSAGGSALLGSAQKALGRSEWSERTSKDLNRADLTLTPAEYLAFRAAAIVIAVAICYVLGRFLFPALTNIWALGAAVLIGYFAPIWYVHRRQNKRLQAFNDSLADTVTLIANSLRAGSSFLQSLEMVTREAQPPISTEFARVVREVSIGLPLEQALNNLNTRVRSSDLELMTTAISIQYQVGGNLAEILDTIAETIRERVRIKGEIRTLTAQQRLSGYIVGFLPIGILLVLMVIAPKFVNPMFGPPLVFGVPLGVLMLSFAGIMMGIGFLLIRRIVNIEI